MASLKLVHGADLKIIQTILGRSRVGTNADISDQSRLAHRPIAQGVMARPEGAGRALATYRIPIEGRDEWEAAARVRSA